MRFLDHSGLARIASLIRDLDVGDRILCGRLELFSTELPGLEDACSTLRNAEKRASALLEAEAVSEPLKNDMKSSRDVPVVGSTPTEDSDVEFAGICFNPKPISRRRARSASVKASNHGLSVHNPPHKTKNNSFVSGDVERSNPGTKRRLSFASTRSGLTEHRCISDRVHPSAASTEKSLGTEENVKSVWEDTFQSAPLASLQTRRRSRTISDVVTELRQTELLEGPNQKPASHEKSLSHGDPPRSSEAVLNVSKLLGTQSAAEARQLLVDLVTTMNACFLDYDFSNLVPESFKHEKDFVEVYTTINYQMTFFVERVIPGFLQDLWVAIRDAVDLRSVTVYSYNSSKSETDPYLDDADCLFNFDYFFVDPTSKRILFFSSVTKRKPFGACSSDDDFSDDAATARRRRRRRRRSNGFGGYQSDFSADDKVDFSELNSDDGQTSDTSSETNPAVEDLMDFDGTSPIEGE